MSGDSERCPVSRQQWPPSAHFLGHTSAFHVIAVELGLWDWDDFDAILAQLTDWSCPWATHGEWLDRYIFGWTFLAYPEDGDEPSDDSNRWCSFG